MCNRRYTDMYDVPSRADTARHGALRAPGVPHQEGCSPFGSRRTAGRRHEALAIHAGRVRQRPHHRGVAPAPQGRRLGLAARGHHGAAPAGGEDRAPCAPRPADGPGQSHAVPGAARAEPAAAGARAGLRRALPRSRPLQGRQRYARTSRRRLAAEAGGQAAAQLRSSRRHCRPARRRRVRHRADQRARSRPDGVAGRPHRRDRERPLRDRRQPHRHRHQHRHHAGAARRHRRRQAHEERRPCAVSHQGRRSPRLLVLQAGDAGGDSRHAATSKSTCGGPSARKRSSCSTSPSSASSREQATGFEALLRWHHPERGPIPPDEFFAIAEDMRPDGGDRLLDPATGLRPGRTLASPDQRRHQCDRPCNF